MGCQGRNQLRGVCGKDDGDTSVAGGRSWLEGPLVGCWRLVGIRCSKDDRGWAQLANTQLNVAFTSRHQCTEILLSAALFRSDNRGI